MKNYKRDKQISVSIRKKYITSYFNKIANGNIVRNSHFWKIKHFLSNKGHLENATMLKHINKTTL